jgi:hypothetical protein
MVTSIDAAIELMKPHLQRLARVYNGYICENSPIVFGKTYDPSTDEYDLVLKVEDKFELGVRFIAMRDGIFFSTNAFFIVFDDGKRLKKYQHLWNGAVTYDSINGMIEEFKIKYEENKHAFPP